MSEELIARTRVDELIEVVTVGYQEFGKDSYETYVFEQMGDKKLLLDHLTRRYDDEKDAREGHETVIADIMSRPS